MKEGANASMSQVTGKCFLAGRILPDRVLSASAFALQNRGPTFRAGPGLASVLLAPVSPSSLLCPASDFAEMIVHPSGALERRQGVI